MEEIIQFELPKQLYALGLVDQHNRIAACFVDPDKTHPEPKIVAVPLTQLGLLHIGNCYKSLRDSVTPENRSLAGKRIQRARIDCRQICVDTESAKCPAPYELDLFRRPELFLQQFHTFRVGRTVYKIPDAMALAALTACCDSAMIRLILTGQNIKNYILYAGTLARSEKYRIELRDDRPGCLAAEQNRAWLYCAAKYQFAEQTHAVLQSDESIKYTSFSNTISCRLPQLPFGCLEIEYLQFGTYRLVVHLRIRNLPNPREIVIVDHRLASSNIHGGSKTGFSKSSCVDTALQLDSSTSAPCSGPVSRLCTMHAESPLSGMPKYEYIRSKHSQPQLQSGHRISEDDGSSVLAYSTNQSSPHGSAELLPADVIGCGKLDFTALPIRFARICDTLQIAHARKMISAPHCAVWHSRCYNSFISLMEIRQSDIASYTAFLAISICHGNNVGILEIFPDDGVSSSCASTMILLGVDDESIYRRALRLVQHCKDNAGHWIKHSADDTSSQAAQRNLAFAACIGVRHTSNYINLFFNKLCSLKS